MKQGIFLIKADGSLAQLKNEAYESEDLLQRLLAEYPNLLSMDSETEYPNRWLLVKREMGVPDDQYINRWSLDHLFLDINGIPTLVEVKRSSDTRSRREVVAQMLDYAANAVVHWPIERIQAEFEATSDKSSKEPDQVLQEFLGSDVSLEIYWNNVKTNLLAGKIRMVFVADVIPKELRRIIEFLNEQMDPAEVIGIEIKQFVGEGITSLVPEVVGKTMESELRKSVSYHKEVWDEDRFFSVFTQRKNELEEDGARTMLQWAKDRGLRIWWGSGTKNGSFYPMLDWKSQAHNTFGVWTGWKNGHVEIPFAKFSAPFQQFEKKRELADRISRATGEQIPDDRLSRFPSVKLSALSKKKLIDIFEVFDWYIKTIQES